jgi:NitT/TauT family transport system permease protein
VKRVNRSIALRALSKNSSLVVFVLAVLVCWEFFSANKILDPFYVSQPSKIVGDMVRFFAKGEVFRHLGITLEEASLGLVIGTFFGVAGGFILGRIGFLAAVFEPIITALYGIPKIALAPIFILWFGLGVQSKIFLSSLMVFYLVFFNTFAGIRNVDPGVVGAVKLLGANGLQITTKVILPSCFPWILAGIRGGVGSSLLGAIVGEYMGASAGLGWMIQYATTTYQIDRVMSCLFILLVIGLVFSKGLKIIEKRALRWRPNMD